MAKNSALPHPRQRMRSEPGLGVPGLRTRVEEDESERVKGSPDMGKQPGEGGSVDAWAAAWQRGSVAAWPGTTQSYHWKDRKGSAPWKDVEVT